MLIRARYLVDAIGYNQVRGLPFTRGRAGPTSVCEEVVITSV